MTGRSGRPKATGETHKTYIRGGTALRSIASEKEALHLAAELRQGSIEGFAAWIDDYGPLGIQPIEVTADGLADTPFDAVAHHRVPEGAGDGKPDVRSIRLRFTDTKSGEERAGVTGTLVINSSKIFRSQQADTFWETRDGTATSRN
jgi:hypothetical protein